MPNICPVQDSPYLIDQLVSEPIFIVYFIGFGNVCHRNGMSPGSLEDYSQTCDAPNPSAKARNSAFSQKFAPRTIPGQTGCQGSTSLARSFRLVSSFRGMSNINMEVKDAPALSSSHPVRVPSHYLSSLPEDDFSVSPAPI